MRLNIDDRMIKIIMLGAGGTGAHIAPNLYRLLYALSSQRSGSKPRGIRFIIADGDSVEEKNLVRQHFSRAELGMNKAKAIAERYAEAFGLVPEYIPDFIETQERLSAILEPEVYLAGRFKSSGKLKQMQELVILIGAVDNNKSRRLCHQVFMSSRNLIYIDSGNGEYTGQVVCGIRKGGRTLQKPVGLIYPDVLEETDQFPSELSCAEASISAPQAITANLTAAMVVVNILYNLLVLGEINVENVSFSTKSVNVRPFASTKKIAA